MTTLWRLEGLAVVGRLEVRVRLEACHGRSELGATVPLNCAGRTGWRWGRGGEGREYISGGVCLSGVEHVVLLTFASWLTASSPAATWSTLATAMRIMYWRWGADTPGYRHSCIHMHTQPLLLMTYLEWNAMDWNVVLATTSHLVQAIFRAFPTGP